MEELEDTGSDLLSVKLEDRIDQFTAKLKLTLSQYSQLLSLGEKLLKMRENEIASMSEVSKVMVEFEFKGLGFDASEAPIFSGLENKHIRDHFEQLDDHIQNPFITFKLWVKA